MNPHSNFNYPIFNNYYHDPRVPYPAYPQPYEPNMFDEAENQDYTFLPKANTFFDHFIGSPLDVTRQSTDVTETHENVPHFGPKSISPNSITYQKYNIQDYNSKFCNLNAKSAELPVKNKFIAVLGASTGITYNGYNVCVEPRDFSSQPTSASITSQPFSGDIIKKEEHIEKQKIAERPEKRIEEEDDQSLSSEVILNVQLKSLLEARIWSSEKDQMLLKLGTQYKCDWKKISKRFNNKKVTPHFLKIRYKELTCAPLQRRVKFNHKEDLMIAKYFEKYGSNWAQMAVHFHNRTAIMLKNRYYSFIRKRELLDGLLQKVMEIEKDNARVDDLKDQESETCYDMFTSQKGLNNDDSEHISTSQGAENEKSISNEPQESPQEHPIFGYERVQEIICIAPITPLTKESPEIQRVETNLVRSIGKESESQGNENKEVEVLKARIKSLQTLYLRTKSELDQYKQKY